MKDIRSYLLSHCKDAARRSALELLLSVGRVGLLLNERVVNVPPELCPALHESLSADLEWAKSHALPALKRQLDFDTLLMISPCFAERLPAADATAVATKGKHRSAASRSRARPSGATTSSGAPDVDVGVGWTAHFLRFEEEIYASQASLAYTFRVAEDENGTGGTKRAVESVEDKKRPRAAVAEESGGASVLSGPRPPQFRHVFAFPATALSDCIAAMHGVVAAAAASAGVAVPIGHADAVDGAAAADNRKEIAAGGRRTGGRTIAASGRR
jgi:hypothetical protein